MKIRLFLVVAGLALTPNVAQAYVDPGTLSALYQLLYLAFFGAATLFIFKPWAFLKSLFSRLRATGKRSVPTPGKPEQ